MKVFSILLVALPLTAAGAPPVLLPSFDEKLQTLPPLSLSENLQQGLRPAWNPAGREVIAQHAPPLVTRLPRYISRMPVREPNPDVDPRMPIKTPDPKVDYHLTVKEPDVASAK